VPVDAMFVGTGIIEIYLSESNSLKDKRGILKRIVKRTQNEFNVSVAEIGANEHWKKALIGFAMVGNDKPYINRKIDLIFNFVEELRLAEVVNAKFEIMSFSASLSTGNYEEDKYG
jgi:uncharacterized protein YlxP (DUF503 family)